MDEHTSEEKHSTEKLQEYLDYFRRIAIDNCKAIVYHKPDLIIGLARGGITPVRATQHLWNRVMPQPCPPVLYCNIGGEKIVRYLEYRRDPKNEIMPPYQFYGMYGSYTELIHYLDWINRQIEWQEALHSRILAATNGRIPHSVLVFDEHRAESKTMVLTLGLLHRIFPAVEAYFIDCISWDWRVSMAEFWMREFYPHVYGALIDEQKTGTYLRDYQLKDALHSIVVGIEDTEPDSFGFNYLQPTSKPIEQLKEYLPAEQWLLLPLWVEEQVLGYIDRYISHTDTKSQIQTPSLYPVTGDTIDWLIILAFIQQWGHITIRQVERLFGVDSEKAEEVLNGLVDYTANEDIRLSRMKISGNVIYSFEEKAESYEFLNLPARKRKKRKDSNCPKSAS